LIAKNKLTIAIFAAISVALSVVYLNVATYYYTASMNVTPAQSSSNVSKLGGLAGIASIAGLSLPQDSSAMSFILYTEGLRSRVAADALARDPLIMQTVFKNEWSAQQNRFVEPHGLLTPVIGFVKTVLGIPAYPWKTPDATRLQAYLQSKITIIQNPKSPVVTVLYRHESPNFAEYLLTRLNGVVDAELRNRSLDRSSQSIAYLTQQLARVTLLEHREAVANALIEQEKQRMFASSSLPFAAEPFGGIVVSLRPTSPQPIVVLIAAGIGGILAGTIWIILRVGVATRKLSESNAL
jgi:uncharacterized protein involved in exopolysaccharide biosynthesis